MKPFEITEDAFRYDGQPIQLLSGAIHYFRIVPEYWEDRLLKLKACGLNCVETYVPWNWHEPKPGQFDFTGMLDLVQFIELAARLDLLVIVRPSPYICAEWEFGGLPAWLLADPGMRLRCMYAPFIEAIDRYYDHLIPLIAPLQCTKGGPVISLQIENEYGSYGNDKEYLTYLEQAMRKRGIDVPLFTSDGPTDSMLQGGTLPHIHKTANFGSQAEAGFAKLREYQPTGPLMCAEFWNGWFDHWGEKHHTRDAADAARCLDEMLTMGASVNIYMFHGGTNFGYSSGANFDKAYMPTVTSYDYDAPLSESGDVTPKFFAFQEVVAKRLGVAVSDLPAIPEPTPKAAYGTVALTEQALLRDSLAELSSGPVKRNSPEPMEMVGQDHGFILYRTRLSGPRTGEVLHLQDVHDRALVFLDGELKGVRYRNDGPDAEPIKLDVPAEGSMLDILVENMGRINYGPRMLDRKGITEGVRLSGQFQFGWEIFPLPLESGTLQALKFGPSVPTDHPTLYKGTFEVTEPADTFVSLQGWTKGLCFINGFNLGRYWDSEPKRNLYIPGPLLKSGQNEILVLEIHGNASAEPTVKLVDVP